MYYPEFSVSQPYSMHKITQSYNPQVNDMPRQRLPNENPKDYMISSYTQLIHVLDLTSTTSIYRLDPFAKYLCCWANQVCPEEIQAIAERTKWKQPNLISFLFYEDVSSPIGRCLKIFYEYLPLDLSQLIQKRAGLQEFVPEEEVWNMIQGLCAALLFLQKRGITHSALNLENIYFDEEYLIYRLQDLSPFRARAPHMFENQFKTPETYNGLRQNRFKQDVFGLGMIIMSLCLLQDTSFVYDQTSINQMKLQSCFDKLHKYYPGKVEQVIQKMITFDQNDRPDWVELTSFISQIKSGNTRTQESFSKTSESFNSGTHDSVKEKDFKESYKEVSLTASIRQTESLDQKLLNLNKKIQETLAKSQNKTIR
ncbi:hypothetical protein pb186bvf_013160 [Paramecium bursaria]